MLCFWFGFNTECYILIARNYLDKFKMLLVEYWIVLWSKFWMLLGKCKVICDEHSGIIYKPLFLEEGKVLQNTMVLIQAAMG